MSFLLGLFTTIIALIISIAWIFLLFKVGQKKGRLALFYVLLYTPLVLSFLTTAVVASNVWIIFFSMFELFGLIIVILLLVDRVLWGLTLKHVSGEDELVWFFIIFSTPLAWFLYHLTKIR